MTKKLALVGAFAVGLVAVIGPAGSCDTYAYSYSNSSAHHMGGMAFCAGTGGTCVESGSCGGGGYCVDDGVVRICFRDV